MREIKFRAWDGEEMVVVKSLEHIDGEDCITTHPGWNINNTLGVPEEYLMQFTGLKDKNGKEIYEGDILQIPVTVNKEFHGEYSYYEVIFNNGAYILSYLKSEKGCKVPRGMMSQFIVNFSEANDEQIMLTANKPIELEWGVIGNIYENPELLNKE